MVTVEDVKIIELPKFLDARGNLSFAEQLNHIPFEIKRTYWIYDVPGGEERGGHAFKENQEFIVALSGAFDVVVDDGENKKTYTLNRSYYGLYIPQCLWRTIENFSTNSLALEFGSLHYDVNDYIYEYEEYRRYREDERVQEFKDSKVQGFEQLKPLEPVRKYNVFDCTMVELDKHHSDRKGNLTVVENGKTLPFDVKRVYYLYDVPGGENRGSHAHKELSQLIIAASGSFTVTLDDGKCKRSFFLNRPYQGLYVKPGMWRDLEDFSSGAVCMVLASDVYIKDDYIRDYQEFLEFRASE
ncbi:MAG: WxcM-like domain-containing protein [Bacteroidales bacterium]|nr:WxcM-like domain-containing protein [Bacteroidales bacterium]